MSPLFMQTARLLREEASNNWSERLLFIYNGYSDSDYVVPYVNNLTWF